MRLFSSRLAATFITASITFASHGFDISKYKRNDLELDKRQKVEVLNPGFEEGKKAWRIGKSGRIAPKAGRSGTNALEYQRSNPKSYQLITQSFKLKPNKFYRFGVWVKTKDLKAYKGGGAGLCLEFSGPGKNGKRKYMSGYFHSGISGTKDWTLVSATKRVPKYADKASLSLYLWRGATGTAWYDDAFLTEQGTNLWTAYTLSPYNAPANGKLTIKMFYDNKPVMKRAAKGALYGQLHFKKLNKTLVAKVVDNKAVFNIKGLPEGYHETKFYCLDTAKKVVLYSKSIPVAINSKSLKRKVTTDRLGRTLVNGKPFLPIGVFTSSLPKKTIDTLTAGGVNCVLPYSSMALRFSKKKPSIKNTLEVLDYCNSKGLKIIFSGKDIGSKMRYGVNEWYGAKGQDAIIRKVVASFKDHPSILAWYVNDEQAISEIPRLTQMRALYNKLDPDHPTYGLDYKYESLPMCGPTADIFGIDGYPISRKKPYSLVRREYGIKQLKKLGLPMWVVPQMMNMGAFYAKDRKDCAKRFRNPSEGEMRAMVLLDAIYGAKGFIFYHYDYLRSWKLPRNNFEKAWSDFRGVVKTLNDLKPFILSDKPAEKVKIEQVSGQVRACQMTDNSGNKVILLVSLGPDAAKAKAVISLPVKNNLKSKFGLTKNLGNGKYEFTASGIDSDILY